MGKKDRRLALDIFDAGLILTNGPFNFKFHERHPDAPKSPMKVNLRGTIKPGLIEMIGNAFYRVVRDNSFNCDYVVGVPKAGDPLAKVVARKTAIPQLFLEKEEMGERRRILPHIRGEYQKGQHVLIIDDVVVMADSKFEAIEAAEANGLIVIGIAVLVDWEHGGKENLERFGYQTISIFKMSNLLYLYLKEGRISPAKYQETIDYLTTIRSYFDRT